MKIITWNVNGIRAVSKKGFAQFVKDFDPDILCIQETKAHRDQLTAKSISELNRNSYFFSGRRKGYSGVATFTKDKPQSIERGLGIPKFDWEGRVIRTVHKEFDLYNIYFPNGASGKERHDFKQEFLLKLNRHLKMELAAGKSIIVLGDYNVAYMDSDVYDKEALANESGFLPEEREWFQQFLDLGFVDGFRLFNKDVKDKFTWWSYRENARFGNRGWRIDHICVSENLKDRIKSCEILDDIEGSDHCPVVLELS
ncbi:MAG: exodeoxyribonuclease III [Bdellovibrionaceae bacterium]|nr:exodeoxyribonuclease III [Pseudobdellovibrionaceae bacterium]